MPTDHTSSTNDENIHDGGWISKKPSVNWALSAFYMEAARRRKIPQLQNNIDTCQLLDLLMCDLMDLESCWICIDDISHGVRASRAIRAPVRNVSGRLGYLSNPGPGSY